jgi:hypothetical protein
MRESEQFDRPFHALADLFQRARGPASVKQLAGPVEYLKMLKMGAL